ncbi:hypothetical protein IU449_27335 [Nocardia higoensis]|uniref:Gas vesicle protein n=1 Tax=Nocardia higoensis TaxID=228599 RepID=A0ABS0DID0_9NOCA|nr:hypothetical protein [Nocardia higoensis]MBF6358215.1 hypothetical protein [Nocardia higoensis]
MNAIWTAVIGASTGLFGVLVGWIAPRSRSLDSQRADFEAILGPLRDEMRDMRDRIKALEVQHREDTLQHFEDVRRIDVLVDYVKDLLVFIRTHVPSPEPPPIPPEFSDHI